MSEQQHVPKKRKTDNEIITIDDEKSPPLSFVNNNERDHSEILNARILVLVSECGELNQVTIKRDITKKQQSVFDINNIDDLVYNHFIEDNDDISMLQKKDVLSLMRLDSDDITYYKSLDYDDFHFDHLPEKLTPKHWKLNDEIITKRFISDKRILPFYEVHEDGNFHTLTLYSQGAVFGALLPHFIRFQLNKEKKSENNESKIDGKQSTVNYNKKKAATLDNNNKINSENTTKPITVKDWNKLNKPKVFFTRVKTIRRCISNSSEETAKFIRENFDYIVLTHNTEGHKMSASTPLLAQGLSENDANFQNRLLDWISSKLLVHGVKCFPPMTISNFLRDKMLVKNAIPQRYRLPHFAFYFPINPEEEMARMKAAGIMMKETIQLLNNNINHEHVAVDPIIQQVINNLKGSKKGNNKVKFSSESGDESAGCSDSNSNELMSGTDKDDELANTGVTWLDIFKRVITYFDSLYNDALKKQFEKEKKKKKFKSLNTS